MKNAVSDRDMQLIRSQAKGIHSASTLPISFCIGERRVTGLPEDFNPERRDVRISEHVVEHVYTGVHQDSGLAVAVYVTEYEDYPVFEIRASFTAAGDRNTAVIHDIRSFDGAFYGEIPVLFSNSGDVCSENVYARKEQLYTHEIWTDITPQCGRPCEQAFPYYKVQFKDSGLNLAVGWPGQWLAHFGTLTDGIRFWAGQQTTNLYIKPGETIIAPRITVMAYDGDYDRGTNLWRRWYREYILPRPNGKPIPPQLFASYNGGGREFQESTEENQLAYIDKFAASGLPYTAWWIDAGWYYCDSESPMATNGRLWYETGSWYADPARYPNGLRPLYEKLKEKGMDLLVWFEPERVRPGTALHREHPEWLLDCDELDDGNCGVARNYMLNLADPDCVKWLTGHMNSLIKEYGITIFRQDFNFPPLRFWQENDTQDRQGSTENLYIQGYLRFWDGMLESNPGLWIDSCASGGRRNDLETMRRSIPLHPTDFGYGYPFVGQAFVRTLDEWLPFHKIATVDWSREDDTYPSFREYMTGGAVSREPDYFTLAATLSLYQSPAVSDEPTDEQKLFGRIWQRASRIRENCDYYPLSETSMSAESFYVNQYYSPESGKGYIQAIRHTQCPVPVYKAMPRDIEADCAYTFEDMFTGEVRTIPGATLLENGFDIALEKRGAAIWFYEKAGR